MVPPPRRVPWTETVAYQWRMFWLRLPCRLFGHRWTYNPADAKYRGRNCERCQRSEWLRKDMFGRDDHDEWIGPSTD